MPELVSGQLADAGPPAPGPVTKYERDVVDTVLFQKPSSVPTSTVPAPTNIRQGQDDATWYTNVVYWLVFRHPNGLWRQRGFAAAPVLVPPGSGWASIWTRIYELVAALLKDLPPPGDVVTPDEIEVLDIVVDFFAEGSYPEVEPETVPPPDNEKPFFMSEITWATNVAFWTTYRAAHSAWIQAGHKPAPIKPDPDSVWAPVWLRMNKYLLTHAKNGGRLARLVGATLGLA